MISVNVAAWWLLLLVCLDVPLFTLRHKQSGDGIATSPLSLVVVGALDNFPQATGLAQVALMPGALAQRLADLALKGGAAGGEEASGASGGLLLTLPAIDFDEADAIKSSLGVHLQPAFLGSIVILISALGAPFRPVKLGVTGVLLVGWAVHSAGGAFQQGFWALSILSAYVSVVPALTARRAKLQSRAALLLGAAPGAAASGAAAQEQSKASRGGIGGVQKGSKSRTGRRPA